MTESRTYCVAAISTRPSFLDQPRTLRCQCCGEGGALSLAAAARDGWEDFADGQGDDLQAVCPACAKRPATRGSVIRCDRVAVASKSGQHALTPHTPLVRSDAFSGLRGRTSS